MSDDNDHIGPYNGHTNRGPDIVASGCLWVVAIFFGFIGIFGGYGFYADWRKSTAPTPDQFYGCTVKQQAPNGDCP